MKKGIWMVVLAGALFSMALPAVAHASNTTSAYNTVVTNDDPPPWSMTPINPLDDPPPWSLPAPVNPLDNPSVR